MDERKREATDSEDEAIHEAGLLSKFVRGILSSGKMWDGARSLWIE